MSTGPTLIRAEEGMALSCGKKLKHVNRMLLDRMTLMHHMAPEKFTWEILIRLWQAANSRDGRMKPILHSGKIQEPEMMMMIDPLSAKVCLGSFMQLSR